MLAPGASGVVFGAVVIDSYADVGAPTSYAAITANGSYRITAAYPRQSGKLIGRIYRTPVAAFGAWDISTFQDVTVVCTYREFIPLRVR
jgi:hypothetical protein